MGQDRAKIGPRQVQDGPRWTKMGSRWPKIAPRWAKMGPRWGQDGPRWGQDGAKMGPRWVNIGPRWAQDVAKAQVAKNSKNPRVSGDHGGDGHPFSASQKQASPTGEHFVPATASEGVRPWPDMVYLRAAAPAADPGRKSGDTCHTAKVQHAIRKRAARLEPLRKRVRQRQIIRDTWEAIAENKNARTHEQATYLRCTTSTTSAITQAEYVYACPFCNGVVTSPVATGNINHRRVCGKEFRVANGIVRPTLSYVHNCPTCGACVHSSQKSGRIQSRHRHPNGRIRLRTEWQVK